MDERRDLSRSRCQKGASGAASWANDKAGAELDNDRLTHVSAVETVRSLECPACADQRRVCAVELRG